MQFTSDTALEDKLQEDLLRTLNPSRNRRLYALVVGINQYQENILLGGLVTFPALSGCVADADKMANYLAEQPGLDTHLKRLTDQQATKAEIVNQFRNHLSQAGPDDTVLFYFSGHGTQEQADPAWAEETDGRLECLACYYDQTLTSDFLLADKELRYLINELWADKEPHIVTIFDCCHSGDNTRAVEVAKAEFPHLKPVEKRIPFAFGQRDWSKFVFADTLSIDQLKTDKTTKSLPEGVHVSLSACEAHESAVEVGGEGVFTKALINILKSTAGSITYHDLQSRARAYLRNVFEQQPRFRVANGSAGMLYRTFLGGSEQQDGGLVGTITHNKAGWSLDKGAIQGLGATHEFITGVGEGSHGQAVRFRVKTIFPDYTVLEPDANLADERVTYKAHIDGLLAEKIRVGFELEDISRDDRATLLDKVMQRMKSQLTVVDDADEKPAQATRQPDGIDNANSETAKADYVVRGRKGQYYLTYPIGASDADDSQAYRPLSRPVDADDDDALNMLASDLSHIARWEYIRQLENQSQNNNLSRNPLVINIKRQKADGSEEAVLLDGQNALLSFEQHDGDWSCPLRVEITNASEVALYVSALYLSIGFESYLSLLPDDVFKLETGKTIALTYDGEPVIPFQLNAVIPLYNWPERVEYLKFIASTELYDAAQMQLEALPDPPTLDQDKDVREKSRGPGMIGSRKPKVKGWTTQRVDLHWLNPTYNQVDPATIEEMLNQESLMDFALGLYFENKTDHEKPAIQLKAILRDLTANVPLRERGLLGDLGLNLANKIARARRNNRYKKAIRQNPEQFKIVSEGDSWFQHPLVTDTIDHLAAHYPVFCVAAAGDTLRNITMAKGTPPVEEYIQAINEQHPDLFVLSGGGNDILGEQFRRYIKADVPPGSAPAAYLEDLLMADLNSLQTMYRAVFQQLKDTNPNLKVLVHGYDYIIPLSVTNKGWLGRYMIGKGIDSHEVRQSILRHILVEFNTRIKAVAGEFPDSVSYIETPGTVANDQWYDEIHPNGEGFARVADKFRMRIDQLMRP
ncbi:MAG: caspase family protein [Rudanella sp.]|nr:caspase family protein [Rudanella sp.]